MRAASDILPASCALETATEVGVDMFRKGRCLMIGRVFVMRAEALA